MYQNSRQSSVGGARNLTGKWLNCVVDLVGEFL
jgi:hypothetical protein